MRATLTVVIVLFLIAAATVTIRWGTVSRPSSPLQALVAAVGTSLPFEARLSGGFAPPESGAVRRSSAAVDTVPRATLSPDVLIATAEIEKLAAVDSSPRQQAALGIAYLVRGEVDRAITTLSDVASDAESAAPWSDLSAAYLVKATETPSRRIEYYARALDAAARSLRVEATPEAQFNRAMALTGLAPFTNEPPPWDDVLRTETDAAWIAAAEQRRTASTPGDDARRAWQIRRPQLIERLARDDRTFVVETTRAFPEAVVEYFEQDQMVAWARAVLDGSVEGAATAWQAARHLADAVALVVGDSMLVEGLDPRRITDRRLAAAHLAYADGLMSYDRNDYSRAREAFTKARDGFRLVRSPYHEWARAQLATIEFQDRRLTAADADLEFVERAARTRGYVTLLGRTLWLRGLVLSKQWRLTEALAAFRSSAETFERAGEREYAVSLYHHLADTLRLLGERQNSWQLIGRTLEGLPRVRKPVRRYLSLYNAALFASSDELFEAALTFQNATVREAEHAGAEVAIDALTQRAGIHLRRGDRQRAIEDLSAARRRLDTIPDGTIKRYLQSELAVIATESGTDETGLESAIGFFERAEPGRLPRLFLTRARVAERRQSPTAIEHALAGGIESLEALQTRLDDDALRVSYFDDSWDLFPEMIRLQLGELQQPDRAFEYAERSRARSLLATLDPTVTVARLPAIQASLPASAVMLYFVILADRLVIWSLTHEATRLIEVPVPATEINRLVRQYRQALMEERRVERESARLFDLLLRPAATALAGRTLLIVVPDGVLHQLPFATLRDDVAGRYAIEDRAILMSPSASFLLAARPEARRRQAQGVRSALLVGNPATATEPPLPGAAEEAAAAAALYTNHTLLTGEHATKARFVNAAPTADVIHFGGHAVMNDDYPLLSRLVLAAGPSGEPESLYAHEIARLQLARPQIVVLAACSTAAGSLARGEGAISLARPFLGAGVPIVVASQWDVDDRATAAFFRVFHTELSVTRDPVHALRAAQLALLNGTAELRTPAAWGAFLAMGTTTH